MTDDDDDRHRRDVEADLAQLKRQEWGYWKSLSERKYGLAAAMRARAVNEKDEKR